MLETMKDRCVNHNIDDKWMKVLEKANGGM